MTLLQTSVFYTSLDEEYTDLHVSIEKNVQVELERLCWTGVHYYYTYPQLPTIKLRPLLMAMLVNVQIKQQNQVIFFPL